jgi:hypothetical protein
MAKRQAAELRLGQHAVRRPARHPAHFLASTTNGTSGNATFGMTSGTNGCSTKLADLRRQVLVRHEWHDERAVRRHGQGPGRSADHLRRGTRRGPEDRAHFAAVTHEHFNQIFSSADVTAETVHTNTLAVLKSDPRLAKYATEA